MSAKLTSRVLTNLSHMPNVLVTIICYAELALFFPSGGRNQWRYSVRLPTRDGQAELARLTYVNYVDEVTALCSCIYAAL